MGKKQNQPRIQENNREVTRLMTDKRQTKKKCSGDSSFKYTETNELMEHRWATDWNKGVNQGQVKQVKSIKKGGKTDQT